MSRFSRGDVVYVDFSRSRAPIKKERPAVVVQNDVANRFADQTILAAIRHDPGKYLPVHVAVPAGTAGMSKNSVVDAGFLQTVRCDLLRATGHRVPPAILQRVDAAIKRSLGLID